VLLSKIFSWFQTADRHFDKWITLQNETGLPIKNRPLLIAGNDTGFWQKVKIIIVLPQSG
jgi:hypothetical protein